ncbi:MAG: lysophospholipid acyltransferase family protein, partial [Paracoccaceae bacterium]
FVNFRIARTAQTKEDARRMIEAHFGRFLADCRISVEVEGTPPEPGKGCVVCYNESSFADVAAFGKVMWPHVDRAAAADLYAYFPYGRTSARKASIELVPRGKRLATERLLEQMVVAVKAGERLAWGGEGRISGKDGVARFKIGASLIAIRSQAPIIPVAFCGGQRLMPFKSIRARPGTIHVRFGAPIPTSGMQENDLRDLADHAQTVVASMYEGLGQRNSRAS